MGVVFRVLQTFMGPQWRPLRVCFSHDAPTDRTEHDRLFGCRVEFGHAFNGIVCSRRDLDVANPDADPGLARLARQMLDAYPKPGSDELTAQVRRLVVSLLGTGACTIEIVAQHLGVDRRTVHRRLAQEGETFSHIVAGVRRELADRLPQGSEPQPRGSVLAPRVLLAQRFFPLASSAVRKNGLGAAHSESPRHSQAADSRTQPAALSAHAPSPKDK